MNSLDDRTYFFDKGIFFECQRCGACCTGESGIIYANSDEVLQIAGYLGQTVTRFIKKYLSPFADSYTIREDAEGRCLFYEDGCTVYPVRPNQCKTYPFWFEHLRSRKKWQRVSRECPGIGRGLLYSKAQILELVRLNMNSMIKRRSKGTSAA